MTVKELREILDKCEDEAEIRVLRGCMMPFSGAGSGIVEVVEVKDHTGTSGCEGVFISEAED